MLIWHRAEWLTESHEDTIQIDHERVANCVIRIGKVVKFWYLRIPYLSPIHVRLQTSTEPI